MAPHRRWNVLPYSSRRRLGRPSSSRRLVEEKQSMPMMKTRLGNEIRSSGKKGGVVGMGYIYARYIGTPEPTFRGVEGAIPAHASYLLPLTSSIDAPCAEFCCLLSWPSLSVRTAELLAPTLQTRVPAHPISMLMSFSQRKSHCRLHLNRCHESFTNLSTARLSGSRAQA